MNNFFRDTCLSMLPPSIQVREGPDQVVVKLTDGIHPRSAARSVFAVYFDGFRSDADFLVIEMNYAFDRILGMPWLSIISTDRLARQISETST